VTPIFRVDVPGTSRSEGDVCTPDVSGRHPMAFLREGLALPPPPPRNSPVLGLLHRVEVLRRLDLSAGGQRVRDWERWVRTWDSHLSKLRSGLARAEQIKAQLESAYKMRKEGRA
jgi:hypothetical protein